MAERDVLPVLLRGWDAAWDRLRERTAGLDDDEYRWEPVRSAWNVRPAQDGTWAVDRADQADQAPVTTIAWRTWHLAVDCFADYLGSSPAERPLPDTGTRWHGDAASALRDLTTAAGAFRAAMTDLGEEGIWTALGPAWGPFAESSWADLLVHATDELAHHGAEIALLRDLYRWR